MADLNQTDSVSVRADSFGKLRKGRKDRDNIKVIADTVYERLRDAILNAELRPNRRLVEDELADWLNVSRTPIREALLCLEKDGLVERNNGWLVREHSLEEIRNRLECRLIIESYAAQFASIRRTDEQLRVLRELADAMEKAVISSMEYYQINDKFHQTIIDATGNPTLIHLYSQTKLNYWNLGAPVIYEVELNKKMHEHHHAVVDAIAAGDGDKAEAISREHVQMNMENIMKSLEGLEKSLPS